MVVTLSSSSMEDMITLGKLSLTIITPLNHVNCSCKGAPGLFMAVQLRVRLSPGRNVMLMGFSVMSGPVEREREKKGNCERKRRSEI